MDELRNQIDEIDRQLVKLLGERMDLVKEIGTLKKRADLPIEDTDREQIMKDNLKRLAAENDLSYEFVNQLYSHIFMESRRVQED